MAHTRSRPCPSWRNPDAATLALVCAGVDSAALGAALLVQILLGVSSGIPAPRAHVSCGLR